MKIAVIEDEKPIREGLVHILNKISPEYQVVGSAENGAEGLILLEEEMPDLIMLDIQMPDMDGLQMLKEARARGIYTKVIILTAYSDFSYAKKAIELGIENYLLKPVNLTEELDGGALFGIYCIAIPGTVLFWSVLSVTVSNLVRNRWIGMGVVLLFWFFSISGKATQFLKNWGPFSYGTCDFGKLTEWRWLGGKVLCVVFAGMMLAFVPKILKKRG